MNEAVQKIKQLYPAGTKILLKKMFDPHPVPPGTVGCVKSVDDIGQIHMNWENGSTLSLNIEDSFDALPDEGQGLNGAIRASVSLCVYLLLQQSKNPNLYFEELLSDWLEHYAKEMGEPEKALFKEELLFELKEGTYELSDVKELLAELLFANNPFFEWIIAFLDEEAFQQNGREI